VVSRRENTVTREREEEKLRVNVKLKHSDEEEILSTMQKSKNSADDYANVHTCLALTGVFFSSTFITIPSPILKTQPNLPF